MIIEPDFIHHPKTRRLIQRCGYKGVFGLIALWSYCQTRKTDSFPADPELIEMVAEWDGEQGEFYEALVACRFIDEHVDNTVNMHGWAELHAKLFQRWYAHKNKNDQSKTTKTQEKESFDESKTEKKEEKESFDQSKEVFKQLNHDSDPAVLYGKVRYGKVRYSINNNNPQTPKGGCVPDDVKLRVARLIRRQATLPRPNDELRAWKSSKFCPTEADLKILEWYYSEPPSDRFGDKRSCQKRQIPQLIRQLQSQIEIARDMQSEIFKKEEPPNFGSDPESALRIAVTQSAASGEKTDPEEDFVPKSAEVEELQ